MWARSRLLTRKRPHPLTPVVIADMVGEETPEECPPLHYEILMVAWARTVPQNVKEVPVYRVSGVKSGSGKHRAEKKTHIAQEEVAQLEQRQYRQHLLQAKLSEHKSLG
jgi:hypothetical protein